MAGSTGSRKSGQPVRPCTGILFRIVFFNSAESPYRLIFLRLANEVVQPLPELFGTRPRSFDVGNADTFIGFRKTAVVSLDRSIFFQPVDDIVRKYKRDGKHLLYLLLEFRVYHSIVHEPFKSFLIGLRVRTFGLSGGETLNFMLCVEGSYRAVDPIETKGFFNRIIIYDAFLTGRLMRKHEPYLTGRIEIVSQPSPPLLAVFKILYSTFRCHNNRFWIRAIVLHPTILRRRTDGRIGEKRNAVENPRLVKYQTAPASAGTPFLAAGTVRLKPSPYSADCSAGTSAAGISACGIVAGVSDSITRS